MDEKMIIKQIIFWSILIFVFLSVFGYAILYYLSVKLFPWFVAFYFIFGIFLIISGILIFIRWEDDPEIWSVLFVIFLFLFLISMAGAKVTGDLIKEIPQTEEGRASLEAWSDVWFVIGIPTYLVGTFEEVINQQLEDICQQYKQDVCDSSKEIVDMYQNTQELKGWINKGNKLIDFVNNKK